VADEPLQQPPCTSPVLRMNLEPGVDEGNDEPAPDRPLMVGGVPRVDIPEITGLVIGRTGFKGAQSDGGWMPRWGTGW
jgi:hypothetical protein